MSHWHLTTINWLDALPDDTVKSIRSASRTQVFQDKETIFSPMIEPDTVYLLEKGLTRLYRCSNSGGEFTLGFVEPGEVFGELSALNNVSRESFAVAIDQCGVLKLPKKVFIELMQTAPSFSFAISKQVGKRLQRIETRAEDLIFKSATSRMAKMISLLANDLGQENNNRISINVRLTQGEIATLVGCSRPTVNLTLNDFKKQGIIELEDGYLSIIKPNKLEELADAAPSYAE